MFGLLTIGYLFLGGAGAGALVVLGLLECANARRRFGATARDARVLLGSSMGASFATGRESFGRRPGSGSFDSPLNRLARRFVLPDEFFARAWPVCFVTLGMGALCLVVDLGRPDRLLNLLVSPVLSPISAGAYSLAFSLAVAAAFSCLALFEDVRASVAAVRTLGAAGVLAGLTAASYTGALLSGLASVLFWRTPWMFATFLLSSLSCGVVLCFLAAAFVEVRQPVVRPLRALAQVDSVLIVLEAACLAGLLLHGFAGEGSRAAVEALVLGEFRWVFWSCLAVLGLAVPFVMERYVMHGNYSTQLLFVAALVLMGGFALRWCMVGAADYDVTQMPGELYGLAQAFGSSG